MSIAVDVADALVTQLNAHTFSQPFVAVRYYVPIFDLGEMVDLHVTIVPRSLEMTIATRTTSQDDLQIDVAIQKKLQSGDNTEVDTLMDLVQEIADFIRATRQCDNAVWIKTENEPIYSPEHLDKLRQFTSVLTLTFRVSR